MTDVEFVEERRSNDEEQAFLVREQRPDSALSGWLIKVGIVKNERVANLILVIIAGVFFTCAIYLYATVIIPSKVIPPINSKDISPAIKAKFPGLKTI